MHVIPARRDAIHGVRPTHTIPPPSGHHNRRPPPIVILYSVGTPCMASAPHISSHLRRGAIIGARPRTWSPLVGTPCMASAITAITRRGDAPIAQPPCIRHPQKAPSPRELSRISVTEGVAQKKETIHSDDLHGFRRRPTLPGRFQPSTISVLRLNFCVRDGNRWIPQAIVTGNRAEPGFICCRPLLHRLQHFHPHPQNRTGWIPLPSDQDFRFILRNSQISLASFGSGHSFRFQVFASAFASASPFPFSLLPFSFIKIKPSTD